MWEQVKHARSVWLSESWGKEPKKCVWWNDEIKAAVRRKETAWKVLEARNEEPKERCMEVYREEKRKVKKCIIQSKKNVNEQFGRKMNENVNGT